MNSSNLKMTKLFDSRIVVSIQATDTKEKLPTAVPAIQSEVKNCKNDTDKRKIFIGNVRPFLTEIQIGEHFEIYEKVESVCQNKQLSKPVSN